MSVLHTFSGDADTTTLEAKDAKWAPNTKTGFYQVTSGTLRPTRQDVGADIVRYVDGHGTTQRIDITIAAGAVFGSHYLGLALEALDDTFAGQQYYLRVFGTSIELRRAGTYAGDATHGLNHAVSNVISFRKTMNGANAELRCYFNDTLFTGWFSSGVYTDTTALSGGYPGFGIDNSSSGAVSDVQIAAIETFGESSAATLAPVTGVQAAGAVGSLVAAISPTISIVGGANVISGGDTSVVVAGSNLGANNTARTWLAIQGSNQWALTEQAGGSPNAATLTFSPNFKGVVEPGSGVQAQNADPITIRVTVTATGQTDDQAITYRNDTATISTADPWSVVKLTSVNTTAAERITAVPDIAIGMVPRVVPDSITGTATAYTDVTLNADGTFNFSAGVTGFQVQVWDFADSRWSAAATQTIAVSAAVSGVQATGAAGTASAGVTASAAVTGVQAAGAVGALSVGGAIAQAITGVAASGVAGNLAAIAGAGAALSGVLASGAAGSPVAITGVVVTVPGASMTAAVGAPTVAQAGTTAVSGVSATGSAAPVVALTGTANQAVGVQSSGQVGAITISATVTVTLDGVSVVGQTAAVSTGSGVIQSLFGVSASMNAGDVGISAMQEVDVFGVQAAAQVGAAFADTHHRKARRHRYIRVADH